MLTTIPFVRWGCIALALALSYQQPAEAPIAIIRPERAEFRFPTDRDVYTWDSPDPRAYPGRLEYSWGVEWHLPEDRLGHDPDALLIVVGWRDGGPRRGTVTDVLRNDTLEVLTFCRPCGTPAASAVVDSAVVLEIRDGSVVFVVQGETAVSRVFPAWPDSVTFSRHRHGMKQDEWTVPLVRR